MHKFARTSIFVLLFCTACSLGPDPEKKPPAPVDDTHGFINAVYTDKSNAPDGQKNTISRWWERINDPLLNDYVDRLLVQNLDIKQAGERFIQARERINTAYGSFYPTLGIDGSATRRFTPGGGNNAFSTSNRFYSTSYSAALNTSWQIDLFGKLRRSAQSAEAGFNATLFERQALIHSTIAALLRTRVSIAVNKHLLDLSVQSTDSRRKIYDIVQHRYELGVNGVTAADVLLAKENYTSVKADIYRYERLLSAALYDLDVMLGLLPGTTDPLAGDFSLLTPPMDTPVCLPADLLDRRPDIQASALRVQAAKADIGVAMADLFPALNLSGSIGFSDDDRYNIFTADQLAGSVMAAITTRLFEGGKLRANIRLQESEAREMAAAYAQDVLNAIREVETALKNEQELTRELSTLQDSTQALKDTENVYEKRYLRGILNLRDFLETRQRRYASEQGLLLKQQQKWNNRINLYLALGGDWFVNRRDQDRAEDIKPEPLPCGTVPHKTSTIVTSTIVRSYKTEQNKKSTGHDTTTKNKGNR